jgi:hypothetical protein
MAVAGDSSAGVEKPGFSPELSGTDAKFIAETRFLVSAGGQKPGF